MYAAAEHAPWGGDGYGEHELSFLNNFEDETFEEIGLMY